MMNGSSQPGRVVSFYSFKGGTGRSMALANVATSLSQRNGGHKVLAIDWDLEAPGLHRYFLPYLKVEGAGERNDLVDAQSGLIEYLQEAVSACARLEAGASRSTVAEMLRGVALEPFLLHTDIHQLFVMKAGRFDKSYSERINTFDWENVFRTQPQFFGALADVLAAEFEYVLIDSRTGYTDISGICTSLMPDTLVSVFTPNLQSLDGVLRVTRQAVAYRQQSDDLRPLKVLPLASRIELSELKLNDAWRFGSATEGIAGYQPSFERSFDELFGLTGCDLTAYFDEAQIAYVPYYAFGERIAVRSEDSATLRRSMNYSFLCDAVQSDIHPWETQSAEEQDAEAAGAMLPPVPWDSAWFEAHKSKALHGLSSASTTAFLEARFSLSRVKTSASRPQLLHAARSSVSSQAGSPFGVFAKEGRHPRPDKDGISAEVHVKESTYDYWALRSNGDFFLLRSLTEDHIDRTALYADLRLRELTDALLYCQRLYGYLNVSPRAEVRILITHSGLRGRVLDTYKIPISTNHGITTVDYETTERECVLGRIETDLVVLVRGFAAPLFELFDFEEFADQVYKEVVESAAASLIS